MDSAMVGQVRHFNRTVTQRAGALDEQFLARARPLGQARLLWEIAELGPAGCDVRQLRLRLGLDSGYLSRLLRSLERDGLVTVGPASRDARVRVARLTAAGRAERAELDRRSDAAAESVLRALSDRQQAQLVAAMADVERLLTASLITIRAADPGGHAARSCLLAYFRELAERFDAGFDPDLSNPARQDEITPPAGLFLLATLHGEPVGCGALKFHPDAPAEIKRMWVSPAARGLGLGRRMLTELETHAIARGAAATRLETNKTLAEAISLYRSSGYREVEPFNAEPYAHHWFEKALASSV
jgi:DNA-binding MarR family transcriptional regulator/GNAT superfamily N-acetyltransferase